MAAAGYMRHSLTCVLNLFFLCSFFSLSIFSFFIPSPPVLPRSHPSVPCLLWPFISAAQEKTPKQGQLGRERNADNILRDLKEIFTPSWELASPSEGNAAQPGQAVCLVLVSLALSWALQTQTRVVPVVTRALQCEVGKKSKSSILRWCWISKPILFSLLGSHRSKDEASLSSTLGLGSKKKKNFLRISWILCCFVFLSKKAFPVAVTNLIIVSWDYWSWHFKNFCILKTSPDVCYINRDENFLSRGDTGFI